MTETENPIPFEIDWERRAKEAEDNEPGQYESLDLLRDEVIETAPAPELLRRLRELGFDRATYCYRDYADGFAIYCGRMIEGFDASEYDPLLELNIEPDGDRRLMLYMGNEFDVEEDMLKADTWALADEWRRAVAIRFANSD